MSVYDRYFAVDAIRDSRDGRNIISDFWEELGHLLLVAYLDTLSLARLQAAERQLCQRVCVGESAAWLVTVEATPELRSSSAMRARYVGNDGDSHVPLVEVTLPHKNFLEGMPKRLVRQASHCQELALDFGPVSCYQEFCSHSSVLTGDPWKHVVLRLAVDALVLDRTLKAVRYGFPCLQILRLTNMPALNLRKQVVQTEDEEEPLAFLVLRQVAHLRHLKALVFQSYRCHPNYISAMSHRAFEKLVHDILPKLCLSKLSLSSFMLQPDSQGRRSVSVQTDLTPMVLRPFLQLCSLRFLRLGAVSYQEAGGPILLDLTGTPHLQELHISFYVGHEDSIGGLGVRDSQAKPLSHSLQQVSLTGLGSNPKGLRAQLARSLALCPCLKEVQLAGPTLQKDFFNELASFLGSAGSLPQTTCWSLGWTWTHQGCSKNDDPQVVKDVQTSLSRWGGELTVQTDGKIRPDLRLSCEHVAKLEERPSAGFASFGKGMDWFLGGRPPGDMSVEQRAVINNRYVAE
mmetsp:Transcript_136247/g.236901  ORF Transcript_136247/g.236901 Transcript_136247/m.236901 type:complete len:516 (-) Transcript_136247:225-1772(-)